MFPEVEFKYIYNKVKHTLPEKAHFLVTGATGFLGTFTIEFLLWLKTSIGFKYKITALDNLLVGANQPLIDKWKENGVRLVKADITNLDVLQFVSQDIEYVDYLVNFAGLASPNVYKKHELLTYDIGYTGTKNVFEVFADTKSILMFSSSEVVGTAPDDLIPTPEIYVGNISTTSDRSCYDHSKLAVETLSYLYFKNKKTRVKVVRPFNVYGFVGQHDTRVIPNFIKNILSGKTLKVYNKESNTRTFCFISDAISGILLTLFSEYNGEIFNIGCDFPEITMVELAKYIQEILNVNVGVDVIPYPSDYPGNEPSRRCPDISKAKKLLGYNPEILLAEGIKSYYDWAKLHYN